MEMNLVSLIIFTVVSIGKGLRLTGKHGPDLVIIFPAEVHFLTKTIFRFSKAARTQSEFVRNETLNLVKDRWRTTRLD